MIRSKIIPTVLSLIMVCILLSLCGCCRSSKESSTDETTVHNRVQEEERTLIRDLDAVEEVPYAPGLTDSERSLITRVILKEVYGEPIMVQIGVAQLIRDSVETRGLSVPQAIETLKLSAHGESELGNLRPQAVSNAQDAVHRVFDLGVCLVPYRLTGMRVCESWTEAQNSLVQVDKYVFY